MKSFSLFLDKYFNPIKLLKYSYILLAIMFFIYATFIYSVIALYIFGFFFIVLVSVFMVNHNVLIANKTDPSVRGKVYGITSSIQSFGQVIAPLIGGVIASVAFYDSPFYFSVIIILTAFIILHKYKNTI